MRLLAFCGQRCRLLALLAIVILLPVFGARPVWADDEKGVIWVDMTEADPRYTADELKEALELRMPDWTVKERPAGAGDDFCESLGPDHYIARIETTVQGKTSVELVVCEDGTILIEEQIDQKGPEPADELRHAAVVTSAQLDLDAEKDREDQVTEPTEAQPPKQTDAAARPRAQGTVGAALGLTIAPQSGEIALSGLFDAGVLFTNNLWLTGGLKLSTSYEAETDKGDAVSVTDRSFWVGLAYLIGYNQRWFSDVGLAAQYTHAAVADVGEKKFEVEEKTIGARFALRASAGLGFRIFPVFAIFLRTSPCISFGERSYKIRGETAVQLGAFMLDIGAGVLFFF